MTDDQARATLAQIIQNAFGVDGVKPAFSIRNGYPIVELDLAPIANAIIAAGWTPPSALIAAKVEGMELAAAYGQAMYNLGNAEGAGRPWSYCEQLRRIAEAARLSASAGGEKADDEDRLDNLTGQNCSVCGCPQFNSPGGVTCAHGHGRADGIDPTESSDAPAFDDFPIPPARSGPILPQADGRTEPEDTTGGATPASGSVQAGWQPIATAPKDGTELLLALPVWGVGPEFAISTGSYHYERWYEGDDTFHELYAPTHWMPLPAAPTNPGDDHGTR